MPEDMTGGAMGRMGGMGTMGGMGAMKPEAPTEAPMESEAEQPSIFLSKATLGDREVKPGDTLTLTVRDVDPETGDVQADLEAGGGGASGGGYAEDFEAAMPAESEAEY